MSEETRRILVGVFGAPQGVRGEVRLKSYTAEPAAVAGYGPLSARDGRRFTLLGARPLKDDMLVVRVEGVTDRDAAAALTHTELYVDRDRLPPPGPDEFYHADLIGLAAVTTDGQPLGIVRGIENYGGGDLVEIAPPAGDTLLVPFTAAFVPEVDFERRRLVVAPGALGRDGEPEDALGRDGKAEDALGRDGEPEDALGRDGQPDEG